MMSLEQAIAQYEQFANFCKYQGLAVSQEEIEQLAEWLKILKAASFEYDEAWRIMSCPTPDVTDNDRKRAVMILNVFRDSLGRME